MIEPTDEMIDAFWSGHDEPEDGGTERGLAAVLAIVERDYAVRPAVHRVNERRRAESRIRVGPVCGAVSPSGRHVCELERGHDRAHAGDTAAWS